MKNPLFAKIIILFATALLAWNYWLPAAEDMFNHITYSDRNGTTEMLKNVDFFVYHHAGMRFVNGDNPYFFGRDEQGNLMISGYHYPPVFLPVFGLFALLQYDSARLLWLVLYSLSYFVVLGIMARSMPSGWRFTFLVAGVLLSMAAYPLLGHILTGQADVFIMVLILGSFLAHASNHKLLSASLLAIGTVLKVTPIFLLAYFVLFLRDFRYLWFYITAVIAVIVVSLFFVPVKYFTDYLFTVLPEVTKGTPAILNQSLISYFSFSVFLERLISIGGMIALAILTWFLGAFFSSTKRSPTRPLASGNFRNEVVFILCLTWVLIFHGGAWPYTYVWLILPSAWLFIGLVHLRVQPIYLIFIGMGIFLILAKDYAIPGLNKLNLWGSILLTVTLLFGLFKKNILYPSKEKTKKSITNQVP